MHYHSYVKNDEIEKRRPLKNKKLYVEQLIRIFNFKMQLNFPSPYHTRFYSAAFYKRDDVIKYEVLLS